MNIVDAYNQMNLWINSSNGEVINIGNSEKYSFTRLKLFSDAELYQFESDTKIKLPEQYKCFLINVGTVDIFSTDIDSGIEILSPLDVKNFSKSVFYNFGDDLYPNLLLTTSIPKFGYFGGFWTENQSNDNYSIYYPYIPPEFWIEEADFISFNEWFIRLVESKGKKL
ncbi:SMI1/KNR4 family protein [Photorhabdus luminescens]|uniref:SMI1/KNR4 family protein n=1 Tax=Photorhabdus akhurstii TaxID=171438 RepID=UPI000CF98CF8|nr:SMI1/KNR4 family protein [Photorhabdus luminescens]PQQ24535.1 SMI1/KNR4 family protein [Photorhabdus luminescens]